MPTMSQFPQDTGAEPGVPDQVTPNAVNEALAALGFTLDPDMIRGLWIEEGMVRVIHDIGGGQLHEVRRTVRHRSTEPGEFAQGVRDGLQAAAPGIQQALIQLQQAISAQAESRARVLRQWERIRDLAEETIDRELTP